MMKTFVSGVMILLIGMCLPSAAHAAFAPLEDYDQHFGYSPCCDEQGSAVAAVHSWVEYDDEGGIYRYLYQVRDVAPDYRINYFQFAVDEEPLGTASVSNYGGYAGTIPAQWSSLDEAGTVYGMGAFFATAVSPGTSSYILGIDSYTAPHQSSGMLSGFGPEGYMSLCGDVFAPVAVPEPATLLLLMGGAAAIRSRRN